MRQRIWRAAMLAILAGMGLIWIASASGCGGDHKIADEHHRALQDENET